MTSIVDLPEGPGPRLKNSADFCGISPSPIALDNFIRKNKAAQLRCLSQFGHGTDESHKIDLASFFAEPVLVVPVRFLKADADDLRNDGMAIRSAERVIFTLPARPLKRQE